MLVWNEVFVKVNSHCRSLLEVIAPHILEIRFNAFFPPLEFIGSRC